ncbi:MAG: Rid family detoxifying hydrolase [Planctomycetota bacterium]
MGRGVLCLLLAFLAGCATGDAARTDRRIINLTDPVGPFSGAVVSGDTLFASGQIGTIPGTKEVVAGGIGPETRQTLENLLSVLGQAGFDRSHITSVTIYLADISDYAAMNEVYREFFTEAYPARACVAVKELVLGARVEISCIAVK